MESPEKEALKKKYEAMSDYELIDVVLDIEHYSKEAVSIALELVEKRGLGEKLLYISEELKYNEEMNLMDTVVKFWKDGEMSRYLVPNVKEEIDEFEAWMDSYELRAHRFLIPVNGEESYAYFIANNDLKRLDLYDEENQAWYGVAHVPEEIIEEEELIDDPSLEVDEEDYKAWMQERAEQEAKDKRISRSVKKLVKWMLIAALLAGIYYALKEQF